MAAACPVIAGVDLGSDAQTLIELPNAYVVPPEEHRL